MDERKNAEARELADKILLLTNNRELELITAALSLVIISVFVRVAQSLGDGRVSWVDQFRAQSNNFLQVVGRMVKATAKKYEQPTGVVQVPGSSVILPPGTTRQ